MAVDFIVGGMDTARVRKVQAGEEEKRAERARDAAVIVGSRGLWDVIEILGLREVAAAEVTARGHGDKLVRLGLVDPPGPEANPESAQEPAPEPKPERVRNFGEAACKSCRETFQKAAFNQDYCSTRCQKRARRARKAGRST